MTYKSRAIWETIRSTTPASIGATYAAIGTPTTKKGLVVCFKNATNGDVSVSDDGVNTKWTLPANSYEIWDVRTNAPNSTDDVIAIGTQYYVKDGTTASTTGVFYIEILVAEEIVP